MIRVNFVWRGTVASKAQLTGSFDNWSERFVMKRTRTGWHSVEVVVDEGEYDYKFVIDDAWLIDPMLPSRTDSLGNINNWIVIGPKTVDNLKSNIRVLSKTESREENIDRTRLSNANNDGKSDIRHAEIPSAKTEVQAEHHGEARKPSSTSSAVASALESMGLVHKEKKKSSPQVNTSQTVIGKAKFYKYTKTSGSYEKSKLHDKKVWSVKDEVTVALNLEEKPAKLLIFKTGSMSSPIFTSELPLNRVEYDSSKKGTWAFTTPQKEVHCIVFQKESDSQVFEENISRNAMQNLVLK